MHQQPASGEAKRAVFVDRDGVLNRAVVRDGRPYPPSTLEALEILPGVAQALHNSAMRDSLSLGQRTSQTSPAVSSAARWSRR